MKCKFKMSHLKDIICLDLSILMVIMDMWRYTKKKGSPIVKYGEQLARLHQQQELTCTIKKGVPTWGGQDHHHIAQVECERQRYDVDRFYLLPVSWCLLGDRVIGKITILSRWALEWVTWSHLCGELKPLHIWHIIFLGSYLVLIHEWIFSLC